jgi:hypothetical protein
MVSESDNFPQDWIDPGEFWDHHYGNFPADGDSREKLTTLCYYDHETLTSESDKHGQSHLHLFIFVVVVQV